MQRGSRALHREADGTTRELRVPPHPTSLLVACEWGDPDDTRVQHAPRATRPSTPRPTRPSSAPGAYHLPAAAHGGAASAVAAAAARSTSGGGGGGGGYGVPSHASVVTSGSAGGASSGAGRDMRGRPATPRPARPTTPAGHRGGGSPAPYRSLSPSITRSQGPVTTPVATRATAPGSSSGASTAGYTPAPARAPSPRAARAPTPAFPRDRDGGATAGGGGSGRGAAYLSTPSGAGLRAPAAVREGATRLLLAGIPAGARVDEVVRLFTPFGTVEAASLVRDR